MARDSLVEIACRAASEPSAWTDVAGRVLADYAADGVVFGVMDRNRSEVRQLDLVGFTGDADRALKEYGEVGTHDPVARFVSGTAGLRLAADIDHVRPEDHQTAEYLKWQIARLGTRHHLIAAVDVGPFAIGFTLHRRASKGTFGAAEKEHFGAVFRRLEPSLRLSFLHGELLTDSYWSGVLGKDHRAVGLLDASQRLIRASPKLEEILRRGEVLRVREDRLQAVRDVADKQLQSVVKRAVSSLSAQAGAVRLDGESAGSGIVGLYPIQGAHRVYGCSQAVALLTLSLSTAPIPGSAKLYRACFGFTEQESRLAGIVASGRCLQQAAAALGISVETGRVHLKRIMRKTETRTQAGLMLKLAQVQEF